MRVVSPNKRPGDVGVSSKKQACMCVAKLSCRLVELDVWAEALLNLEPVALTAIRARLWFRKSFYPLYQEQISIDTHGSMPFELGKAHMDKGKIW